MGLDTKQDRSLWKDRALVEVNIAVLSSFQVSITSRVHNIQTPLLIALTLLESTCHNC